MNVDPAASMRCWAVDLRVGGRTFEVPALPAADWFPVLVAGDPSLILDFLKSDPSDENSLDEMLLAGQVDGAELGQALLEAIEVTAGRSFHAAFVLATVASTQWSLVNGPLARRGFRWDVQPLGAALDAIYYQVVSTLEKDPREKFLRLLENDSLRSRDREAVVTEFETLAGPKPTGGLKASGAPSDNARPKTRPRPRPPRQDAP